MSEQRSWHVDGLVWFDGGMKALTKALVLAGVNAKLGAYAVRIKECSHFVLVSVGDPENCSTFEVDGDADSEAEMVDAAERVSAGLRAASIRHDFEVYGPAKELVKRVAHPEQRGE